MKKKLGPLQIWQWGAIVGGGLGLYLLLKSKKVSATEPEPRLVGSALYPGGAEGNVGGSGLGSIGLTGEPGPVGAPGPAGEPGMAGEAIRELSPATLAQLDDISAKLNNPPTAKSAKAPKPIKPSRKAKVKRPVSHKAKGHKEAHQQAHKEHRATVHAPKAAPHGTHTHGGAVAHRQHGRPAPIHVSHPAAKPHPVAPHPAPRKPAKHRGRR